jgi:predicted DNA-binding transcriptional regulator YafY
MKQHLKRAFMFHEPVIMMYMAKDGSVTKRKVKVLKMGHEKFQAYCYTRHDKRTFIIDRVLAVQPIINIEKMVI